MVTAADAAAYRDRILAALPAIVFISFGVRWLVAPAGIAPFFGMDLMEGLGRSTVIGDMAAAFLTMGISVLTGLITQRRTWIIVPAIFMALAALGRLLAWAFHDATLATNMIGPEILIAAYWFFATKHICEGEKA